MLLATVAFLLIADCPAGTHPEKYEYAYPFGKMWHYEWRTRCVPDTSPKGISSENPTR